MTHKVKLSNGYEALIDQEDLKLINNKSWFGQGVKSRGYIYAASSFCIDGKWKIIYLHRLILNAKHGQFVDHINGNTLDCRKSNLRICDNKTNQFNQRKVRGKIPLKGVTFEAGKYRARIRHNGGKINLGSFDTMEEAARAYDKKAFDLRGEFAVLNYPKDF